MISKATEYNWKKLNSDSKEKLNKRANKTQSLKRIVAFNYLNYEPANILLETILSLNSSIADIIYSLCLAYLKHAGILKKNNVKIFLSKYEHYNHIDFVLPDKIWDNNEDVIGFIYQSLLTEGERNLTGQYYTSRKIVEYMLKEKVLSDGETFLDPCCGSGAFLLAVNTKTPSCLFGFDINPIAVMIASTNLLVKYAHYDFIPNIYCVDFLQNDLFKCSYEIEIPLLFDNVYTNPPWGADKKGLYISDYPNIKSKERSSMFIVEALKRLKDNGELYFLLPTSLLKIKTHNDIRKYILKNTSIQNIDLYEDRFDGVFTDCCSIRLKKSKCIEQQYRVTTGNDIKHVKLSNIEKDGGLIVWTKLSDMASSIVEKMDCFYYDDLSHSRWALGIVTGDNKSKLQTEKGENLEPIYVGKQIVPFRFLKETSYILFEPKNFQQCAKEELFRAPEKLIYRFIAKYPIVAYDNEQRLCLNSANILIPDLAGMSIKTVAAFLNSSLYRFYYSIKFPDIKVLKGNLQKLPFPKITKEQDAILSDLVSFIQESDLFDIYYSEIEKIIYSIFKISNEEQIYIQEYLKH